MTQNKNTESTCLGRQPAGNSLSTKGGPLLIAGGEGMLGKALARACKRRVLPYVALGRAQFEITRPAVVKAVLETYCPAAVLNAAGYVDVVGAQSNFQRCLRENLIGPLVLARFCETRAIQLVLFSSAMVFNGGSERRRTPYRETDATPPRGVYARSKELMERFARRRTPKSLILRTSALFGSLETQSFLTKALRSLAQDQAVSAATDAFLTPAYLPDLCDRRLEMVFSGDAGIRHMAHPEPISRFDMIARASSIAGISMRRLCALPLSPSRTEEAVVSELPVPRWAVLTSEHGVVLPSIEDTLERFVSGVVSWPTGE